MVILQLSPHLGGLWTLQVEEGQKEALLRAPSAVCYGRLPCRRGLIGWRRSRTSMGLILMCGLRICEGRVDR